MVVCLAVGLAPNLIIPSLPQIAADFHVDYGVIQYALSVYYAANGLLQLGIGPFADRLGRKPVLICVLAVYALASLGCALSTDIAAFFIFRTIQAIAFSGAVISRTIARDSYDERGAVVAVSYIGMTIAVANMSGPALGGFIFAELGWRANFLLTSALGAIALLVILRGLPETRSVRQSSIAQQFGDFFVLMKSPNFWAHALVVGFSAGTYFAYLGGIAIVAPAAFDLSPEMTGLLFGLMSSGYIAGSFTSGRFARRYGNQHLILAGTLTGAVSISTALVLFYSGLGNVYVFYISVFFIGSGYGMTIPNANVGLLTLGKRTMGSAAGFSGAMMVFIGAIIISISGTVTSAHKTAESLLHVELASSLASIAAVSVIYYLRTRQKHATTQ